MTRRLLLLAGLVVLAGTASLKAQTISLFGNAATGSGWSYNPATSTINGLDSAGNVVFGSPANIDLGSNRYISLTGNATTAPLGTFTITLEDDASHLVSAQFKWADFSGGGTTKISAINVSGTFNFAHITGWTLDAGGSQQAVTASFSQLSAVAAIPEPSTALTGLAGLVVVGFALRRRLKKAGNI
jgi:hypothetical protein